MYTTLNKLQRINLSNLTSITTIDIEGDGLDREINQKLFTKPPHIDPGTRIWCVSFAVRPISDNPFDIAVQESFDYHTSVYTYVCKLPDTERTIYDYNGRAIARTVATHKKETKVPHYRNARNALHPGVEYSIVEIPDYTKFLTKVANVIDNILSRPDPINKFPTQPIMSKGYGNYNYDEIVLKNACNKHGIKFNGTGMISLSDVPKLNSTKQVSTGQYKLNQLYLETGIEHNVDDTLLLNEYIYNNLKSNLSLKLINKSIMMKQIEQDFEPADTLSQS